MTASKFYEVLDGDFQSTSPKDDVRLEDVIAQSEASSRTRSPSATSNGSAEQSRGRSNSQEKDSPLRRLRKLTISGR